MWRGASLLDLRSIKPEVKSTSRPYPRFSLHKGRPELTPPYTPTQAELAQATLSCSDNSREIVDYASDGLLEDLVTRGFGSTILTGEIRAAVAVAAIEKSRKESSQKPLTIAKLDRIKHEQSIEVPQTNNSECKRVDALPVLRILSVGCGSGKIDIPFLEAISKAHLRDGSLLQGRRFEYIGIDPSMRRLTKIATWVECEHPLWENYLGGSPDYPDNDSDTSAEDISSEKDSDEGISVEDSRNPHKKLSNNTVKLLNLSLSGNGLALNKRNTRAAGKMTVAQVLASIPRLRSCKDTSFYGLARFPSLKQISLSNQTLTNTSGKQSLSLLPPSVSDTLLSTISMKSGGLLSRTTMNMFDAKKQQRIALSKTALLPLLQSDQLESAQEKATEKTSCVSLISMSLEDLLESIDKTLSQTSLDAFREASDDVADSGAEKADVFATPSHLCVAGSHFDLIFVEHSLYGCRTSPSDSSSQSKTRKTSAKKGEQQAPLLTNALSSLRSLLRQRGRGIMLIVHRDPESLNAIRCLAAPRIEELSLGAFGTPLYSKQLNQEIKYLSKNAALAASEGKLLRSAHATAEESNSIRFETAAMLQHVHADHIQEALEQLCGGSVQVESQVLSSHADTTRLCAALAIAMDGVKKSIPVPTQQMNDIQPKRLKMRRLTSFLAPISQPSQLFPEPTPQTPRMRQVHLRKRDIRLLSYLTGVAVDEDMVTSKSTDSDDEDDDEGEALPITGNSIIQIDRPKKSSKPMYVIEKLPPLELLLAVDMASVSFDKVLGRIGKVRTIAEMQEQAESNKRKKNAVLLPDRLFIIRSEDNS